MPKAEIYNLAGQKIDQIELNKEIFAAPINGDLMVQAINVNLANRRLGTAKVKTRGEVDLTTRKMYAQKHTGRARHGSASAPIFVGGGIVHGPNAIRRIKALNQGMRRQALFSALSQKARENKIIVLEDLKMSKISSKEALGIFRKLPPARKTLLTLVENNKEIKLSFRNLKGIETVLVPTLNAYMTLKFDRLVFSKAGLEMLEKHFLESK